MEDIKFYLIHGVDKSRKKFMKEQFDTYGLDNKKIIWMEGNNKDTISGDLIKNIYNGNNLTKGQISLTYKHYLALKNIIENKYTYAVIMEDNIQFKNNVPNRLKEILDNLPESWDIVFDCDGGYLDFIESKVSNDQLLYKKNNQITKQCLGSSRCANFYLLNYNSAKKLFDNFIPFTTVSDHWLNILFRKLNLNVYWTQPTNVIRIRRKSTLLYDN